MKPCSFDMDLPIEYAFPEEPYYVFLGLGSNIGERAEYLQKALALLQKNSLIKSVEVSSFYETPAWGKTDQAPFINCVAKVLCECALMDLLKLCQKIELDLGRERHEHWGPRTIDIDLLCTDDDIEVDNLYNQDLKMPHPYMLERSFVLVPLAEIAPDVLVKGIAVKEHLSKLADRDTIIQI